MKTTSLIILIGGMLLFPLMTSGPAQEVSVGVSIHATADFEAPLAPLGGWVEVGSYGRCWHPRGLAADWRPYCGGQWTWTDCGWYWETDEPWGWACYHYGSWYQDPVIGWVWVPGVEWAPAWVVWRSGGGYIGWAPCAPRGVVVVPGFFAFVEVGHFHDPIRRTALTFNSAAIIGHTTEINNVRRESRSIGGREQRVVINEGPGVAPIERATGKHFEAAPIQEVARRTRVPDNFRPTERRSEPSRTEPGRENRGNGRAGEAAPSLENRGGQAPHEATPPESHREESRPAERATPPERVVPPASTTPAKPQPTEPPRDRGGDRGSGGGGRGGDDKDRGR